MKLITHPPECPNPGAISVHNPKPKFWSDRERNLSNKKTVAEGLQGKETWHLYHKILPPGHIPLA